MWNLIKEIFIRLLGASIAICAILHAFDLFPVTEIGIQKEMILSKPGECVVALAIGFFLLIVRVKRVEDLSDDIIDKAEDLLHNYKGDKNEQDS